MKKQHHMLTMIIVLVTAGLACAIGGEVQKEATVQALGTRVVQTATGAAAIKDVTRSAPQTAEAKATEISQQVEATGEADQALSDEARQATATAAVPIMAALNSYGVDPSHGRVGWMHPPVTIEVEGYQQYDYANDFMATIVEDFVISADITWNTQYGTSGCGFMLRSDGDQNKPNQYMVIATRGGNGHVLLVTVVDGEIANSYDIYARGTDRSFAWQNDTTNRLAVVGRGNLFSIYTNGTLLGEIDVTQPPQRPLLPPEPQPPADQSDQAAMEAYQRQLQEHQELIAQIQADYQAHLNTYREGVPLQEKGFAAMVALSESGRTTCQFEDAWLWLIEE